MHKNFARIILNASQIKYAGIVLNASKIKYAGIVLNASKIKYAGIVLNASKIKYAGIMLNAFGLLLCPWLALGSKWESACEWLWVAAQFRGVE